MANQLFGRGIGSKFLQSHPMFVILVVLVALMACSSPSSETPISRISGIINTLEPDDEWSTLIERKAYPFTTPLPQSGSTPIDGTYVKFDPKVATPIPCRRCPDYMNEGGIWKLRFDNGTFHILHQVTGWTGIGSFTIDGNQLAVFNDPKCPDLVGLYAWRMVDEDLALKTIDDHCAADMRSHNLEQMVWQRCPDGDDSGMVEGQFQEGCN